MASWEENATKSQEIQALVSSLPMKWAHHLISLGCDPFNHKTQEVGPELEFLPEKGPHDVRHWGEKVPPSLNCSRTGCHLFCQTRATWRQTTASHLPMRTEGWRMRPSDVIIRHQRAHDAQL